MSEAEDKRTRIAGKIAASQERLTREGPVAPPVAAPVCRAPQTLSGTMRKHPGLIVAGGLAIGLAAGFFLPRLARGKVSKRALSLMAGAGEVGLALGRQALERAGEAARDGREKFDELGESLGETASEASRRARSMAGSATGSARSSGLKLARQAIELAKLVRR